MRGPDTRNHSGSRWVFRTCQVGVYIPEVAAAGDAAGLVSCLLEP